VRSLHRAYHFYIGSFSGLSREVWILALITFVNRAGTMVVPFLSLYLTKDMGLSLEQVGWIMSCFGAGSVLGSWAGGKLTDRLGFYDIMIGALLTSGVAFILLQYVKGYEAFCVGVFVLMLLSDARRKGQLCPARGPHTRGHTAPVGHQLGLQLGPCGGWDHHRRMELWRPVLGGRPDLSRGHGAHAGPPTTKAGDEGRRGRAFHPTTVAVP
jgi:hypothetical protein